MLVIPVVEKQRQKDGCKFETNQPELHSEFQDSLGYTVGSYLESKN